METVQQDTFAMKELLDEGRDGLTGLARALLEAGVNEMMAAQADAMCEATGSARNGFRERRFETQVGTITLRIPKLRRGTYFPDGAVERWSRIDRVVICAVAEMYALGVSTRKVGRVLERMGADRLSKDAVSRICAAPGAEVAELRTRQLPGIRFLHLWVDATYVPCHRNDHGATAAVVAATAVGGNGLKRVVDLSCVDAESYASWKGFLRGLRERGPPGSGAPPPMPTAASSEPCASCSRARRGRDARRTSSATSSTPAPSARSALPPGASSTRCSTRATPGRRGRSTGPPAESSRPCHLTPGGSWRGPRRTPSPTSTSPRCTAAASGRTTCRSARTGRSSAARASSRASRRRRR